MSELVPGLGVLTGFKGSLPNATPAGVPSVIRFVEDGGVGKRRRCPDLELA